MSLRRGAKISTPGTGAFQSSAALRAGLCHLPVVPGFRHACSVALQHFTLRLGEHAQKLRKTWAAK